MILVLMETKGKISLGKVQKKIHTHTHIYIHIHTPQCSKWLCLNNRIWVTNYLFYFWGLSDPSEHDFFGTWIIKSESQAN